MGARGAPDARVLRGGPIDKLRSHGWPRLRRLWGRRALRCRTGKSRSLRRSGGSCSLRDALSIGKGCRQGLPLADLKRAGQRVGVHRQLVALCAPRRGWGNQSVLDEQGSRDAHMYYAMASSVEMGCSQASALRRPRSGKDGAPLAQARRSTRPGGGCRALGGERADELGFGHPRALRERRLERLVLASCAAGQGGRA
jgi:hypothetical protein